MNKRFINRILLIVYYLDTCTYYNQPPPNIDICVTFREKSYIIDNCKKGARGPTSESVILHRFILLTKRLNH